MKIEDDEKDMIRIVDDNGAVHATFGYTRGLPTTRGSAKMQANAWLQGYRYAKMPASSSKSSLAGMEIVRDIHMRADELIVAYPDGRAVLLRRS